MSNENQQEDHSINWGKLGKGVLAGAAIVAGALIVFPGLAGALVTGVAGIGGAATAAGASASAASAAAGTTAAASTVVPLGTTVANWWAGTAVAHGLASATAGATWMEAGIGALITKAIGVVAAVAGASYFLKKDDKEAAPDMGAKREEEQSFAVREDMRRMQALMVARMQATGYQPAMAVANQQGR